jgi:hypothetical protein
MEANPWVVPEEPEPEKNPWVAPEPDALEATLGLPIIPDNTVPETTVIEVYKQHATGLIPKDASSRKSCILFAAECKRSHTNLEKMRVELVEPHVKEQKRINKEYGDPRDAFKTLEQLIVGRVQQYDEQIRIAAEREQKRLNDLADQKRRELEAKEAALKAEAEKARAAGDEKAAVKLETKAETVALKAVEVIPETVELPSTKTETADGTMTIGAPKKTWNLPGYDKAKPMRVMERGMVDHRIASIIGDINQLPAGVLFLLEHCDLNPVHLNKSYNGGRAFPKPFSEAPDLGKSRLR